MSDSVLPLAFLLAERQDIYPRRLESGFPHVIQRIVELWQDREAIADYFTDLMIPKRPGRRGFPPEVAAEIMALSMAYDNIGHIQEAEQVATPKKPPLVDAWSNEAAVAELDKMGVDLTMSHFSRAVEAGNDQLCSLFLRAGFAVDARDARHWTPLMMAAFNGQEKLALQLIENGADIHAYDNRGYTPLHWAAFNGYPEVVELLLSRGVSPNVASQTGITPLIQASARGHLEVVMQLINGRANPDLEADDGSTALFKAVANGHLGVVNLLLAVGADAKARLHDGTSLLTVAQRTRDAKLIARISALAT